ncbi:MAG: 3-oxoacyl-ACP reductase FabG [Kineosporiaceae bacterium]|nr:3-oxoacyl-ACP reductase FabG [Kineosporiaceae bacterium]MBK7622163.1 3-oxoacyl-ACP reductase FabG [Kineosporiaceae bacterium]MBK8074474.1 3-oxoacyl-ACP reductase FabG [Kineosporiaceae bacterium]
MTDTLHVDRGKLEGRVAFVTGGTRGIGAAICRSLASQGAAIAAGYSSNDEAANAFAEDFRAKHLDGGGEITLHKGNIGVGDDCRRAVQEVVDQHGRIDLLVNNAGITIDRTVAKMTDDDWNKVIAVNLSGAFYLSQAVLPHFIAQGTGRIVMVSSVIGEMGNIGQANYAASKSGLFGLTKTLAREVEFQLKRAGKHADANPIGITVNCVTPGFVATEMLEHIPEKVMEGIKATIPVGRLAQPDEIARVVHFLSADASGYITGQVWGVNGGLDMH